MAKTGRPRCARAHPALTGTNLQLDERGPCLLACPKSCRRPKKELRARVELEEQQGSPWNELAPRPSPPTHAAAPRMPAARGDASKSVDQRQRQPDCPRRDSRRPRPLRARDGRISAPRDSRPVAPSATPPRARFMTAKRDAPHERDGKRGAARAQPRTDCALSLPWPGEGAAAGPASALAAG